MQSLEPSLTILVCAWNGPTARSAPHVFLQLGFDLLMQVLGELPVRQSVDHFVEKAACDEALSYEIINAAALKIKQFFGFHLPGSCPVRTTYIIGQNLETRHRIRLSFIAQQQIPNLLIGVGSLCARLNLDQARKNRSRLVV